jgi:hypothetical protein
MQDWLTIGHDPIHFDYEFTSVFAAGGFDDRRCATIPIFFCCSGERATELFQKSTPLTLP